MTGSSRDLIRTVVAGVLLSIVASAAQAQTVVNLTNLDPTQATLGTATPVDASTNLNLLNTTTALSNGGLFGGAVSTIPAQQATNQLNTLGMTALGGVSPVILGNQAGVAGGNSVTINEITSAYNATTGLHGTGEDPSTGSVNGSTSATISNTNAAVSSGVNQIIGASSLVNSPYNGGYGGTAGGATVNGGQIGVNTLNGVGAAFADSTAVTLSQLPGQPSTTGSSGLAVTPIEQGGAVNTSVVNTLMAYTNAGPATVNGASVNSSGAVTSGGGQTATNTFNTATLQGTNLTVGAQQLADGFNASNTTTQSVNQALAFSAGNTLANVGGGAAASSDPLVQNLRQSASASVNSLNLLGTGTTPTTTTLTGLQTNGYTTASAGTTGTQILTNQASASTTGTGSFLPYSAAITNAGGQWSGLASMTAVGAVNPNNTTPATQVTLGSGAAGYSNSALTNGVAYVNPNNGYSGNAIAGVGNASLSNVAQGISSTSNTLSAGSTSTSNGVTTVTNGVDLNFGTTGFEQRTGTVGTTVNPYGLNAANATTNAGTAALSTLSQSFNQASNTLSGSGAMSGTLTQSANAVDFAVNQMQSADGATGGAIVPNGGPGQSSNNGIALTPFGTVASAATGLNSANGPYIVQAATYSPVLNNAQAQATFGGSSLSGVAQTGTSFTNVASVQGNIDTNGAGGANSGTLTQQLGGIQNYGQYGTALNQQVANSPLAGSTSVTGATQQLALYGNALSTASAGTTDATSGAMTAPALTGSISQAYATGLTGVAANNIGTPQNYVGSIAGASDTAGLLGTTNPADSNNFGTTGQGTAALSNVAQSNAVSLNSIASSGASGSNGSPLGVSQQSGTLNTTAGAVTGYLGTSYNTNGGSQPSNLAIVASLGGAGGNATGSGIGQQASFALNTFSSGSTAGSGVTGNITQTGVASSSSIGNVAGAYAQTPGTQALGAGYLPAPGVSVPSLGTNGLGVTGVMSGNATLTNVAQGSSQQLNAMSLTGANNGILNQATIGATLQNTANQAVAQANRGYATATGTQIASNAVNTIVGH